MRWFILFVSLLISFPMFAIAGEEDWKWIVICEVFSEKQQKNVEVYREQIYKKLYIDSAAFSTRDGNFSEWTTFYVEWGQRSCKIMTRETFESQER